MLNVAGKSALSPTYRDKVLHFLVQWLNVCFWHKGAIHSPQSCTLLQVRPHPVQLVLSAGEQGVVWGVHSCRRAMNTITIIVVKWGAQFLRYVADQFAMTTIVLCKTWLQRHPFLPNPPGVCDLLPFDCTPLASYIWPHGPALLTQQCLLQCKDCSGWACTGCGQCWTV